VGTINTWDHYSHENKRIQGRVFAASAKRRDTHQDLLIALVLVDRETKILILNWWSHFTLPYFEPNSLHGLQALPNDPFISFFPPPFHLPSLFSIPLAPPWRAILWRLLYFYEKSQFLDVQGSSYSVWKNRLYWKSRLGWGIKYTHERTSRNYLEVRYNCSHFNSFRITFDGEFEPEDPITEKLALYTFAHVSNTYSLI
jgi:hypothetical protein